MKESLQLPLALLAVAGVFYIANRRAIGKLTSSAPTAQVALDPNMPAATAAEVAAALKSNTDKNTLLSMADAMDAAGYGNSAAALRAKANLITAGAAMPGLSSL